MKQHLAALLIFHYFFVTRQIKENSTQGEK